MKAKTATCGAVSIDGLPCTLQANTEAHTFGHYDEGGSSWPLTPDDISAWAAPHRPSEAASTEAFARVMIRFCLAVAVGMFLLGSYLALGWWGPFILSALVLGGWFGFRSAVRRAARRLDL